MRKDSGDGNTPLLANHQIIRPIIRTGTLWTASAHIITGVIGSGVLSLGWSMAQLGWIAGPLAMLIFASVTAISAYLLCDCYRSPHPEHGPTRNTSYYEAVDANLGVRRARLCNIFVQISLYGVGVAYTVTSGISMRAIQRSNCYHKEGQQAPCKFGDSTYMLIFGLLQVILSQIPNLHEIQWLSIIAAVTSFSYSGIGLGLGMAKVIENGYVQGSLYGVKTSTVAQKVWLASQALGDVAFAYPFSIILIEIQDTLKAPPPENETMKKASAGSILVTTFFYLCCGGFGYAAFGNATPGNLLTGFGFYEPFWLVDFANICIVIHLVGGYQVYSQPLFALVEKWFTAKFPESGLVTNNYTINLPLLPPLTFNLLRLCFRSAYVVSTTAIAMFFPYFNQILGVLGAINFWPLTIFFPVEMYFKQWNIQPWTAKWIALQVFSAIGLAVTLLAFVGSFEGLVTAKLSSTH